MKLSSPGFWKTDGFISRLLALPSIIYMIVMRLRHKFSNPDQVAIPVICVGNITMGGTGKTPVALALADLFDGCIFLTRGYGGKIKGPLLVDSHIHTSMDVGDEACLLAQKAPTWVARNRFQGAIEAFSSGARLVIMDDGFQNFTLHQDIRFVVVDGHYGFGNEKVFPAGPLRESLNDGLARAHGIILIGPDLHNLKGRFAGRVPVFGASIHADTEDINRLVGKKVVAFAGIGHPDKFRRFLLESGCVVADFFPYPDHYVYTTSDIARLKEEAIRKKALLVTTEKDYVRLHSSLRSGIEVCRIRLNFDDIPALFRFMKGLIKNDQKII